MEEVMEPPSELTGARGEDVIRASCGARRLPTAVRLKKLPVSQRKQPPIAQHIEPCECLLLPRVRVRTGSPKSKMEALP